MFLEEKEEKEESTRENHMGFYGLFDQIIAVEQALKELSDKMTKHK